MGDQFQSLVVNDNHWRMDVMWTDGPASSRQWLSAGVTESGHKAALQRGEGDGPAESAELPSVGSSYMTINHVMRTSVDAHPTNALKRLSDNV